MRHRWQGFPLKVRRRESNGVWKMIDIIYLNHIYNLEMAQMDVRSTTGRNLRHLMLQTSDFDVREINPYREPYETIPIREL